MCELPKCLPRRGSAGSGSVLRHQVTELPPIQPQITEYRCHRIWCPECGKETQAPLPPEVAGDFGPNLAALIAYLTVVCRMPRRVVLALLEQGLGIRLSLGSVQSSWAEMGEAVADPCAELEKQLPHEPVINSDETGYRTEGEKRWLWAFVASIFVVYKAALTRGTEVLVQMLGSIFAGTLCSDRYQAYFSYHKGSMQLCWAHFKRNILGVHEIAKTTDTERFCRDALALHARLFRLWHRFRNGPGGRYGPVTRQQLIDKSIPIQKGFFALADRYLDSGDKDVRNLARAMFQHCEKFFVFIEKDGVEPTNTQPNAPSAALSSGVRPASAAEAPTAKSPWHACSPSHKPAACRTATLSTTFNHAIRSHRSAQPVPSLLKISRPT